MDKAGDTGDYGDRGTEEDKEFVPEGERYDIIYECVHIVWLHFNSLYTKKSVPIYDPIPILQAGSRVTELLGLLIHRDLTHLQISLLRDIDNVFFTILENHGMGVYARHTFSFYRALYIYVRKHSGFKHILLVP